MERNQTHSQVGIAISESSAFPSGAAEHALQTLPIEWRGEFPIKQGSAHPGFHYILQGGFSVICKPEDGTNELGPLLVRHEVAAYKVSQIIGWQSLVATTVLRSVESHASPGTQTVASVQVLWHQYEDEPDVSEFSDEQVWQAAVFDVVTRSTDRTHNWLGLRLDPSGPPTLKLIDHGHSFDYPDRSFVSIFADARRGQSLPEAIRIALVRFQAQAPWVALHPLVSTEAIAAMQQRVETLLDTNVLDAPS